MAIYTDERGPIDLLMKLYRINPQIGRSKHSISFHDGEKTHPDGSPFWDIRIFSSVRQKSNFEKHLVKEGYKES